VICKIEVETRTVDDKVRRTNLFVMTKRDLDGFLKVIFTLYLHQVRTMVDSRLFTIHQYTFVESVLKT